MRISDWSSDVCSSDLVESNEFLIFAGLAEQRLGDIDTQRAERRIPVDANADRQPWLPTETVEVFGERSDRVRTSGVRRAARACAHACIGIACLAGRELARIVGCLGGPNESGLALPAQPGFTDRPGMGQRTVGEGCGGN